ncbi:MAG: VWA domain-containing protein [Caldilineae bacterium]|nr:MAG: VWA domain-containing protein [Caldilineae bacterium]
MTTFRFASPWLLALLAIVPLLAWWHLRARRRRRPAALRYADTRPAAHLPPSWRLRLRPLLPALRLATLALLVVAAARPQAGHATEVIRGEGVDIALALDISGSMASLDFQPQNRLEAAKQVIAEFVAERRYDRIGLVVFAQEAFNQSPPTIDHDVLLRLLKDVRLSTDLGVDDGTAIGLGLANAANMLKDSTAKSKVVILLTDGVNNAGQIDPLTAAEAARALGIKVYTIGAARPGKVPFPQRGLLGTDIVYRESELDEDLLRQIADRTGGLYFRAKDTAGLQKIYEEINSLEKSKVEIRTYTRYRELAAWLLVPALILFALEMVLRQTLLRTIP